MTTDVHPLLVGTRLTIGSWDAWRKRWDEAVTLEERLGLLHVGLSMELGSLHERIVFYLDVANGHNSLVSGPFGVMNFEQLQPCAIGGSNSWNIPLPHILKTIAKKAFSEVAKRYFVLGGEYPNSTFQRADWLNSKAVVDKIVSFVQPDEEGRVCNLDRDSRNSHATMLARKFYLELSKLAFEDWREYPYRNYGNLPGISKLLIPKRAQLIPALEEVGDVRWLLRPDVVNLLDDECIGALKRLALTTIEGSFPGERDRRSPATIAEAAYLGSHAAHVLLLREIVITGKRSCR